LRVMSPTRYQTAPPRVGCATNLSGRVVQPETGSSVRVRQLVHRPTDPLGSCLGALGAVDRPEVLLLVRRWEGLVGGPGSGVGGERLLEVGVDDQSFDIVRL